MTPRDSAPLRTFLIGLICIAALLLAGTAMPRWLTFLLTMSFANGIVALGINQRGESSGKASVACVKPLRHRIFPSVPAWHR